MQQDKRDSSLLRIEGRSVTGKGVWALERFFHLLIRNPIGTVSVAIVVFFVYKGRNRKECVCVQVVFGGQQQQVDKVLEGLNLVGWLLS